MTSKSHRIWTIALASVCPNWLFFGGAVMAACAPDTVEQIIPGAMRHRGASHLLAGWLGAFIGLQALIHMHVLVSSLWALALGFAFGGLCHVILDSFSVTGVPVITPRGMRLAFGAYTTGTYHEVAFYPVVLTACFLLSVYTGHGFGASMLLLLPDRMADYFCRVCGR